MQSDDRPAAGMVLLLLATTLFLITSVTAMLGPILLQIAAELHTSVAITGQLVTVTAMIWGLTALSVGPLSDTYGRRLTLLTGLMIVTLGLLGGALATSYEWLFAARILTGLGGAMVLPTCFAAAAEFVSPRHSGHALAWMSASSALGMAAGMPLVAWVAALGGWRAPFWTLCAALLALWFWVWGIFPRHVAAPGPATSFMDRLREASVHTGPFLMLLTVNLMVNVVFWSLIAYLPAYLVQTYHIATGAIVLPLALMGAGVLCGALAGAPLANFSGRRTVVVCAQIIGGLLFTGAFLMTLSVWTTVAMACAAVGLLMVSQPMILTLLMGLSGTARGTASGIFAMCNQLGAMGGSGLGGLLLSFGGFPSVAMGGLAAAVIAALVMQRTRLDFPCRQSSREVENLV